jgi:hypothetical protein
MDVKEKMKKNADGCCDGNYIYYNRLTYSKSKAFPSYLAEIAKKTAASWAANRLTFTGHSC